MRFGSCFCGDQIPAEIARPTKNAQIISHGAKQIPGMFSIFPKFCNCLHTVSAILLGEKCVALDLHRRERAFSPILDERLTPRCASAGRRRSGRLEISGQAPLFNATSSLLRRRLFTLRFRILCCAFSASLTLKPTDSPATSFGASIKSARAHTLQPSANLTPTQPPIKRK